MTTTIDLETLQLLTAALLDEAFSAGAAGPLPNGPFDGTVLLSSVNHMAYTVGRLIRLFVWRGKTFDAAKGVLYNRFPTLNAVSATMSIGPSLHDSGDCIVLDYSETIRGHVRDELRLVAPGLYLGIMYQSQRPILHFALRTPTTNDDGHV